MQPAIYPSPSPMFQTVTERMTASCREGCITRVEVFYKLCRVDLAASSILRERKQTPAVLPRIVPRHKRPAEARYYEGFQHASRENTERCPAQMARITADSSVRTRKSSVSPPLPCSQWVTTTPEKGPRYRSRERRRWALCPPTSDPPLPVHGPA